MLNGIRRRLAAIGLFLVLVAGMAGGVWWAGYLSALDQLAQRGRSDLALAGDRLTGELQRYRELAVMMADHPGVAEMVARGTGGESARDLLRTAADKAGALDILVIGRGGAEIASASGTAAVSHAGEPYFERASDGALGLFHNVSDRYGRRAFHFASPIFSEAGPVAGVVVFVVDIDRVEAVWRGDRPTVYFKDDLGVVFVSNRSELVFRAETPPESLTSGSAEYPEGLILPFLSYEAVTRGGHELWQVEGSRYVPDLALRLSLSLPVIQMTGEALLDVAPARQIASLQAAFAAALCLAFGAMLFLATERRRTLALANEALEQAVARRTAELSRVNEDLQVQVAERTAAEAQLKKAQADLVQAGKLSALGQMSAGISHELNQPLMAIRSYAENAEAFLSRGKPEVAAQNLSRIAELARRMGRIIKNLRAFAKQETEALRDVDLPRVIDGVLEMVAERAKEADVTLDWVRPPGAVVVRGGEVRLSQVVLNLVTNAMDAMEGQVAERRVEVRLDSAGPRTLLTVRDTGPGLSDPDKIFDPFFSTKSVEKDGMGLGLSISYGLVQSFGGAIQGRNHPGGGAEFVVELETVLWTEDAA